MFIVFIVLSMVWAPLSLLSNIVLALFHCFVLSSLFLLLCWLVFLVLPMVWAWIFVVVYGFGLAFHGVAYCFSFVFHGFVYGFGFFLMVLSMIYCCLVKRIPL